MYVYVYMLQDVGRKHGRTVQPGVETKPGARINGVTIQKMAANKRGRELYIGLVTDDM